MRNIRNITLFFTVLKVSVFSIVAKENNSILSPKYWDLQGIYSDSLCTELWGSNKESEGLFFHDFCVADYYEENGVRYSPWEYPHFDRCETLDAGNYPYESRYDGYEITDDIIRFWGDAYWIWKLNKDTLILKDVASPHRFCFYKLSADQISSIKIKERKVPIGQFIKSKLSKVFFEGENGLTNNFALYDNSLQKEMKLQVYFSIDFNEESLDVYNYKISKIKYYDEVLNKWNDLDEVSTKKYSAEISNCIHHFSFEPKDVNSGIPWKKVNKNSGISIEMIVFP